MPTTAGPATGIPSPATTNKVTGTLADPVAASGPMDPSDAVRVTSAAASALGAAHAAGVLHRDVKPGNILIDAYGAPRLSDFGIAAILREGQPFSVTLETLTPEYAPPEAFTLAAPTPAATCGPWGPCCSPC
ncbi:protein kinase domain-containing protein [Actinomyces respiraculi]|uniref:protein kinase domain-containing protein n=1 Tax=Actinomyces respiraculi TaxID=2744574 RepID=UPI0018E0BB12|nr:protein kinase [Actinomyces respiraculi]